MGNSAGPLGFKLPSPHSDEPQRPGLRRAGLLGLFEHGLELIPLRQDPEQVHHEGHVVVLSAHVLELPVAKFLVLDLDAAPACLKPGLEFRGGGGVSGERRLLLLEAGLLGEERVLLVLDEAHKVEAYLRGGVPLDARLYRGPGHRQPVAPRVRTRHLTQPDRALLQPVQFIHPAIVRHVGDEVEHVVLVRGHFGLLHHEGLRPRERIVGLADGTAVADRQPFELIFGKIRVHGRPLH
mmetsp:Transcript_32076/g.72285  ORF Transcript_32076/g.72285 Transcript_32076/m.72285 type:complete len:238 (+) Transcript_32076:304-1017(+)